MPGQWLRHDEKDPPGISSFEADRYPAGFSADILVGARHDFHMQASPVCMKLHYSAADPRRARP